MARPAVRHPPLFVPRARPGCAVDVATREAVIGSQRHPARRLRRVRRLLRAVGTVMAGVLAMAVTGVVAAGAVHTVRTTALLGVDRLEVVGARRLTEGEVRAVAAVSPGTNLFALDVDAVTDRVEALPGVRRARVVRHLPNRVSVLVEEREPYALVNVTGPAGGLFWVDADGYLVAEERHATVPPLPILSDVERPAAGVDHPVGDRLRVGLALLRTLQRAGGRLPARISEVDVVPAGGPVLYTMDGAAVWVGPDGWEARLARLDGVLGELEERGEAVESVDLRFRDLVVLRPRKER